MKGPARQTTLGDVADVRSDSRPAFAQINMQPTRPPAVTAENERVVSQAGEPVMFAGSISLSRPGAATHFIANEMIRSGSYRGIPLYTPHHDRAVQRGLRADRRRPDAAVRAAAIGRSRRNVWQQCFGAFRRRRLRRVLDSVSDARGACAARDWISAGGRIRIFRRRLRTHKVQRARPHPSVGHVPESFRARNRPCPFAAARRTRIFVEFENSRWFSSGPPVPFDSRRFTKIGEFHDFPVYATAQSRRVNHLYSGCTRGGRRRPLLEAEVAGGNALPVATTSRAPADLGNPDFPARITNGCSNPYCGNFEPAF